MSAKILYLRANRKKNICTHTHTVRKSKKKTEVGHGVAEALGPCDICGWMERLEMRREGQAFSLLSLN